MDGKRLYKSDTEKKISGVCGGIAEYFDVDPSLIRVAWVIFTLISVGWGIIGYFVIALILPKKNEGAQ